MQDYIRDSRSPTPSSTAASRVMSANRAKDTVPELALRRALWSSGLRGYRLHRRGIPGRPDISFGGRRVAIFVNGCFWHRCPHCKLEMPRSNTAFWRAKFERNQERDARKTRELEALGWKVITVWECEIKKDVEHVARAIARVMHER